MAPLRAAVRRALAHGRDLQEATRWQCIDASCASQHQEAVDASQNVIETGINVSVYAHGIRFPSCALALSLVVGRLDSSLHLASSPAVTFAVLFLAREKDGESGARNNIANCRVILQNNFRKICQSFDALELIGMQMEK